jgi:hypothetical protein
MKESDTQKSILEWLAWKHIFHYRNNSGAFVDSQKHFYRFGAVGSPDNRSFSPGLRAEMS